MNGHEIMLKLLALEKEGIIEISRTLTSDEVTIGYSVRLTPKAERFLLRVIE